MIYIFFRRIASNQGSVTYRGLFSQRNVPYVEGYEEKHRSNTWKQQTAQSRDLHTSNVQRENLLPHFKFST